MNPAYSGADQATLDAIDRAASRLDTEAAPDTVLEAVDALTALREEAAP